MNHDQHHEQHHARRYARFKRALRPFGLVLYFAFPLWATYVINGVHRFTTYMELSEIAAPSKGSSNIGRLYLDSTSGDLGCVDDAGASCFPAAASGLTLVEQHTASASSTLDFTTCISATYDTYEIQIVNIVFSTAAILQMRMSTDGGSSYAAGASDYRWLWTFALDGSDGQIGDTADDAIDFRDATSTLAANTGINAKLVLYDPGGAKLKAVLGDVDILTTSLAMLNGGGLYLSTTAVNAFRFLPSTGNFTSGTIRCYGVAK